MGDEKTIFFQKIDDCLLDEKKVVTYKWLSQFLNIDVNQAKQLLAEYAEALDPQLKLQLEVTYAIGGKLKKDRGCSFLIVKKEQLPKARARFSEVTTEHVYSLEMMVLTDLNHLFTVDYVDADIDRGFQGGIRCRRSVKITRGENIARRQRAQGIMAGPSSTADHELMDVDEGPSDSRKRSLPPGSHSSKAAPAEKRDKFAENVEPKVPDVSSKPPAVSATTSAKTNPFVGSAKPPPSMTAPAVAATKASTTVSKTAANPAVTGKGKAGTTGKVKKSKKIFGDTPERRVQTSLTAFFKKE